MHTSKRRLKVCEAYRSYMRKNSRYYDTVPRIQLMGTWLTSAGFNIGDEVNVTTTADGKLVIEKLPE